MSTDEPKEFLVRQDEDSNCYIELDVDIHYRPCKNHFRLYSRYDTSVRNYEYEYKTEGTSVFVRLIQDRNEDPGEPESCDVLDGVVQETAMREREEKKKKTGIRSLDGSVEEKIVGLKKQTEWTQLSATAWNGFPYFLLACNLPRSDARRHFRQELERLTRGEKVVIEAAAKLGYEPQEAGKYHRQGYRTLRLAEGQEKPSDEKSKAVDLPGVLTSVGLTWDEFNNGPILVSQLQELLGDESQTKSQAVKNGSKESSATKTKSKGLKLAVKGVSWLTLTVLMAGYYAFALMLMWNWFVAQGLHLPELSFVEALGIIWTISLLRGTPSEASPVSSKRWELLFSVLDHCVPENKIEAVRELIKESTEGVWAELIGGAFGQAFGTTVILGLGWTAHTFFM
jgi:hypothetical protein